MTREEIIAMAREAGYQHPNAVGSSEAFEYFDLECFASLVAATEREACAQIVERNAATCDSNTALRDILMSNAAAIRARGEA